MQFSNMVFSSIHYSSTCAYIINSNIKWKNPQREHTPPKLRISSEFRLRVTQPWFPRSTARGRGSSAWRATHLHANTYQMNTSGHVWAHDTHTHTELCVWRNRAWSVVAAVLLRLRVHYSTVSYCGGVYYHRLSRAQHLLAMSCSIDRQWTSYSAWGTGSHAVGYSKRIWWL